MELHVWQPEDNQEGSSLASHECVCVHRYTYIHRHTQDYCGHKNKAQHLYSAFIGYKNTCRDDLLHTDEAIEA